MRLIRPDGFDLLHDEQMIDEGCPNCGDLRTLTIPASPVEVPVTRDELVESLGTGRTLSGSATNRPAREHENTSSRHRSPTSKKKEIQMTQTTDSGQLAALTSQLHVLNHTADPSHDSETAERLVAQSETLLLEMIRLQNSGGYFTDLLGSAPQCHAEVKRLAAGQQHLLVELQALHTLAAKITPDDVSTATKFSAMWSRWVSHLTTHEYLEGRLLQNTYGTDNGGEA
jgi:hypothetical protein